jgi:hypothetical protein
MKIHLLLTLVYFLIPIISFTQINWYVGHEGTDNPQGGSSPETAFKTIDFAIDFCEAGDTLNLLAGTYFNENYLDGDIWKDDKTLSLVNIHGKLGADIVIRPNPGDEVLLKGDGLYIFHIRESSFIRVEGFEIEGEVEQIPLDSALAYQFIYKDELGEIHYRVPPGTPPEVVENMTFPILDYAKRPTFFDTKGFVIQNSHHITVNNCHIHHMPGTGLRTNGCDYIWFVGNEINDCSRRSPSGTHALVLDSSESLDEEEGYKFFLIGNEVHHNYNEIYSWSKNKSFITPVIDEGKGISLQRNTPDDGWTHGRMLVANNITYLNGLSGVHSNNGARIDFIHNTAYYNSFTGRGGNIGISLQRTIDARIINNISVAEPGMEGYAISVANSTDVSIENNLVSGNLDSDSQAIEHNTVFDDPLFEDSDQWDFRIKAGSPAIGKALAIEITLDDFYGNPRDNKPDIGAVEFQESSDLVISPKQEFNVFPNPAWSFIQIKGLQPGESFRIVDLCGNVVWELGPNMNTIQLNEDTIRLDRLFLPSGIYIIQAGDKTQKLIFL